MKHSWSGVGEWCRSLVDGLSLVVTGIGGRMKE